VPRPIRIVTCGLSPDEYPSLGLLPELHIAMSFDSKRMNNGLGQRIQPPRLNGVSGGPVWKVYPSEQPVCGVRLAGIVIEHHKAKKAIVATRIDEVLAAIACEIPSLAKFIVFNGLPDSYQSKLQPEV
jgi:hypothetical protein